MISHAIFFASSHLTPPRTALSSTPPPTPRFSLHPRLPPRASLHIPPCTPPSIPPELHLAPCTPLFTLLCAALLPPRIPSCPSPCAPTPHSLHPAHRPPPIPILIPQPSLFFLPSSSPSLHVTPFSSRPPISIALLCSPGFL